MSLFTEEFGDFLQHSVLVETFEGANAFGDQFSSAAEVEGLMVQETSAVVQVSSGEYQQSEAMITGDLPVFDQFKVKSKVTLPSGRVAYVIKTARHALDGWPSHFQAWTS